MRLYMEVMEQVPLRQCEQSIDLKSIGTLVLARSSDLAKVMRLHVVKAR